MKERKNLDNLFQESFENFEAIPPENAWKNIELRLLEKKRKKKIVPLWWKLSGIAAGFVLGFFILNSVYNNKISIDNSVVNQENNLEKNNNPKPDLNSKEENKNSSIKNLEINNSNENVVTNDTDLEKTGGNSNSNSDNSLSKVSKKTLKNLKIKKTNEAIVTNNKGFEKTDKSVITNSKNSVADVSKNTSKNLNKKSKFQQSNSVKQSLNTDSEININNIANNQKNTNSKTIFSNNKFEKNIIIGSEKSQQSIVNNSKTIFTESNEKSVGSEAAKTNFINSQNSTVSKENNTKTEEEITKNDSTKIAVVEPNALEELLKEKEKQTIIVEQKLNRWQISTNVAPIYFSSTSNGSPLDSEFKNNSKSYNTNISYGLGVNYAVNKKLKIRTGVNKLSADYTTNDIVFYQNNNASKIDNVKSNTQGSVIQLESKNSNPSLPEINGNGFVVKKFDSGLNQKFGYIEVPVEMSYSIINKKFGIDLIGGLSTLFLNENQVAIVASGVNMDIGEADNLNDVHFSGNLGLGFKYAVLKNLEARIEPVFKYQINTFSSGEGDFNPYIFGVYSGITFTF